MRCVIVGLGNQGRKRLAHAGRDVIATVDPQHADADYRAVESVPLNTYDAALVCTPDAVKYDVIAYCLSHGKHVLVEKPLVLSDEELSRLAKLAAVGRLACYTAYNHRFEPLVVELKQLLDRQEIGDIYVARLFYGNGTAEDVRRSPWRDRGRGVITDLGSHLLDLVLFLFGEPTGSVQSWGEEQFETAAPDYAVFGVASRPRYEFTVSLVSWCNTFSIDVFGSSGSAHVQGLCKWGPSTLTLRRRVWPSGRPPAEMTVIERPDPTWALEYDCFKELCESGGTTLEKDRWIASVFSKLKHSNLTRVVA